MMQKSAVTGWGVYALTLLNVLFHPVQGLLPTLPTTSSQCGPYTVSWNLTNANGAVRPSTLRLIPVNPANAASPSAHGYTGMNLSVPVIKAIPQSVWNSTSQSGTYTIPELPFRSGEAYIVAMDYGSGMTASDISSIFQVGSSPANASCLTPYASGSRLNVSSYEVGQCDMYSVSLVGARTIRGFVLGSEKGTNDIPTMPESFADEQLNFNFPMRLHAGNQLVYLYEGFDGKNSSTGLINIVDGGADRDVCFTVRPPTSTSSRSGGFGGSIGGIIGGLLGLLILVALVFFCCKSRKDRQPMPAKRSQDAPNVPGLVYDKP